MDGELFDKIARELATASRRSALRLLAGGALGAAGLAAPGPQAAAKACETDRDCPKRDSSCCDRRCTDTSKDDKHCGKCGRRCKGKETCCAGNCADVSRNRKHCGKCGKGCKRGEACERGKCKKRQPKPPCRPQGEECTGLGQCCSQRCCLDVGEPEGGERFCAETGSVCCTADEGGGACDAGADCCEPTVADPEGFCCVAGFVCCGDACCPAAGTGAVGPNRAAKRGRTR